MVAFNLTTVSLTPEVLSRIDPSVFLPTTLLEDHSDLNASIPVDFSAPNDTSSDCFQRTLTEWKQISVKAYVGELLDLLLHPSNHPEFVVAFLVVLIVLTTPLTVFCCLVRRFCNFAFRPRIMEISRPCPRRHFPSGLPPPGDGSSQADVESPPDSSSNEDSLAGNPPSGMGLEMQGLANHFHHLSLAEPLPLPAGRDTDAISAGGSQAMPAPVIPTPPPLPAGPLVPPCPPAVPLVIPARFNFPAEPASRGL